MPREINLLVPGLPLVAWRAAAAGRRRAGPAKSLDSLLNRARTDDSEQGLADMLCGLAGVPRATGEDFPVAALCRHGRGLPCDGYWLRADPVVLHADRDRLLLNSSVASNLPLTDAHQFAKDLTALFQAEQIEFHVVTGQEWYVKLPGAPGIRTANPDSAVGRNLVDFLPAGPESRSWRRRWTEMQMLLHDHPLNQRRRSRGHEPINGVWLWGGGKLPGTFRHHAQLWGPTDNFLLHGIAKLSNRTVQTPAEAVADVLASKEIELKIVVLAGEPLSSVDAAEGALSALVRDWFDPLRRALIWGKVSRLVLWCDGHCWQTDSWSQRRFWG